MARQTIAQQLETARVILEGAAKDTGELKARLAAVGYDAAALQAGEDLYEAAGGAHVTKFAEVGDQKGATATVNALRAKTESQYSALNQIAKTVFADNPDAAKTLGLNDGALAQPRPPSPAADGAVSEPPAPRLSESQAAFFDRATILYQNALGKEDIGAELSKVGYTKERLEREWADVQALQEADIAQESEKAEAKASTAAQKAALQALNEWISRFKGIVVPALKDRPDLLSKLHLKPRGGKH